MKKIILSLVAAVFAVSSFAADTAKVKKTPEQVEKYWARMIFTGKAQPPREIKISDVKSLVAETPGAISYLDSSKVDGSLKIVRVEAN